MDLTKQQINNKHLESLESVEDCWILKMGLEVTSTWRKETPLLGATSHGIFGSGIPPGVGHQWLSFWQNWKKIRSFLSGSWALSILVSIHEFYLFVRISSKTCPCSILDAFIFLDLNNCIITSISYTLFWMLFGYTNIGGPLKIQRPYNLIQSVC